MYYVTCKKTFVIDEYDPSNVQLKLWEENWNSSKCSGN
jgi:hypothetical protein